MPTTPTTAPRCVAERLYSAKADLAAERVLVVRGLATQRLPVARYRRGTRSIAAEELDKVSTNDVARIEAESRQIRAERKLDS